ncbi:two pore domain potassium channel family protein [Chloroflexota bacterium]
MVDQFETPRRRGDRIIHISRKKSRRRLLIAPDVPRIIRFIREMGTQTPLVPSMFILVLLWLLSSWGLYATEYGVSEQFDSFGDVLWWTFTAMQTQGANSPGPITPLGRLVGSIWSIVSTIGFFGVIIATLYAYFMLPRHRPFRAIIDTLQYNLEQLENLSVAELEVLRDTIVKVINVRIDEHKQEMPGS